MEKNRERTPRLTVAALALCLGLAGVGSLAFAAEPAAEIQADASAGFATLSVYSVDSTQEVAFVQAVVESGGYVGFQPGFANERIIRSLSSDDPNAVTYFVFTRHFSRDGMKMTLLKRADAVLPYLAGGSAEISLNLEEHRLPNWGWERGTGVSFTRLSSTGDPTVLNQYGTSLSFFKYGYTGQTAVVRTFPASQTLTQVRQALALDSGLAGASIFHNPSDGSFVIYAEYFATPSTYSTGTLSVASAGESVAGAEAGVVVENYRAR